MDGVTITSLMTNVGEIFTASIGWVGEVGTAIVSDPLLLLKNVLPLCGIGVGLFGRLIHAG